MRVVHVDTGRDLRGGQHQLMQLARGLRERGHEQLIVCPDSSALEARARHEDFQLLTLPAHDPFHAHAVVELRQRLRAAPAGILHAHDGRGQTIAWLASAGLRSRARRVASRRVTFSPAHASITRLKYGRACDGVIAVSERIRMLLLDAGVPSSKIAIIPDGVEIPLAPPPELRARARAAWQFHEDDFVLGHVGAFTREKGQDLAVEAVRLLEPNLPHVRLVLAGYPGPPANRFARAVQAKAAELGEHRVQLLGYVEDLADFFPGLDLYIMPSRAEGLGSSALTAMAHGLPVVASSVGGLPEIVEQGKTGWLVMPESPQALAEAVDDAVSDPARLVEFGENARARAREFSSDLMVDRTEAFYARLLGRMA